MKLNLRSWAIVKSIKGTGNLSGNIPLPAGEDFSRSLQIAQVQAEAATDSNSVSGALMGETSEVNRQLAGRLVHDLAAGRYDVSDTQKFMVEVTSITGKKTTSPYEAAEYLIQFLASE